MIRMLRRWMRWFLAMALMVAAFGCGSGSGSNPSKPSTASQTYPFSESATVTDLSPSEKMVDVGGYRLLLRCGGGPGSPTVVFVNGFDGIQDDWDTVRQDSHKLPRMCSYDYAGTGTSEATPTGHVSADDSVHDLATLLARAGEKPPYVLVGWSWGGLVARIFQHRYPDQAVGLVLVESSGGHLPGDTARQKTGDTTVDIATATANSRRPARSATWPVGRFTAARTTRPHAQYWPSGPSTSKRCRTSQPTRYTCSQPGVTTPSPSTNRS